MQQAPARLVQCMRLTFRASRPANNHWKSIKTASNPPQLLPAPVFFPLRAAPRVNFYSTRPKLLEEQKPKREREETLQTSKDDASSQPSTHLNHGQSHEPPRTDPNLDPSLPSQTESRRTQTSKRFSHLMDNVQANIFVASRRLNDLTGYSGIEALKSEIEAQESLVQSTRAAVRSARTTYSTAVATRSATQREVNDLLQRKHAWSPSDLERFTSLYQSDHRNEQAEQAAQDTLSAAERAAEEASSRLARTILARYHEEQIWSDKIRQMSTWGTWGLMGLNVLLFIVFQIAIEPWRRRRLVKGFEEKVMEAIEREGVGGGGMRAVAGQSATGRMPLEDEIGAALPNEGLQEEMEAAIEAVTMAEITQMTIEEVTSPEANRGRESFGEPAAGFAYYQEAFQELFSDRKVVVTQRELTTVAIEGAAGGAAVMGVLLVLLRPK